MGRVLLFSAAILLFATALVHTGGQPMVDGWVQGLDEQQKAAICLVWLTDSLSWAVVSILWVMAGWKQDRAWLGAAVIAAAIPLGMVIGIMRIDPTFFGGWMLAGSTASAALGIGLVWRSPP